MGPKQVDTMLRCEMEAACIPYVAGGLRFRKARPAAFGDSRRNSGCDFRQPCDFKWSIILKLHPPRHAIKGFFNLQV
jgi:hypothetical protein